MSGAHGHHQRHHSESASQRRLWLVLGVLATFTAVEAVGGF